ncbi:MAG: hypothetical protein KAJ19_09145 [Gammaproteobacteria bacterium]|nr:hypothetical protein [Gammaproteobacteria bacterium]
MATTLDSQKLFDQQQLKIELGSVRRDSLAKAIGGVDDVLSIDSGCRGRKLKQTGTLRAKSKLLLNERIGAVSAFMDGDTHTLITEDGEQFDNLRIDVFELTNERASGSGLAIDYKITYTQLRI